MNKNKIIFLIIGVIVIIFFIGIFTLLNGQSQKNKTPKSKEVFNIWVIGDNATAYQKLIEDFKTKIPKYKNSNINVVSFPNYEEYYNSLVGSFINGKTPDIFSLNNNDNNFFDNQIQGITNDIVNIDEFRKNYDSVFSQDLIKQIPIDEKNKIELLAGIPLGYETLGIFYNFREVKGKKLNNWSYVNEAINEIKQETGKVGIGIGNGSTVKYASDIVTQFIMLDGLNNLKSAEIDKVKPSISNYLRYGDENLENGYNTVSAGLLGNKTNNLNLFSAGDIQMVIGYPRMIEEIDKNGFNKSFLRAEPFPTYSNSGTILVNYNYLSINKNTKNLDLSYDFIRYLSTKEGQQKYLDLFSYYLPSMLSLLENRLDKNVYDGYSIKYKDFYNRGMELSSFNKGIRVTYDKELLSILDNGVNGIDLFEILRKRLLCISNKMITGNGLEVSCDK